jgi:anhydro-N-acetylmuramic acid kinase
MLRIIGLISGTSVDGIDAALVEISGQGRDLTLHLLAGETYPYPPELRSQILAVCGGAPLSMEAFASLDDAISHQFAQAALQIQTGYPPADWIGSHGQTVYHRPPNTPKQADSSKKKETHSTTSTPTLGYSLQLGRGDLIAHLTQIPTISNFRAADIAVGGQGAPLVPALDICLLSHPTHYRCVQNIGGIGNVAYLPPSHSQVAQPLTDTTSQNPSILGWDTGPGNALLDLAVQQLSNQTQTYDHDGAWAATGKPCQELVTHWLQQDFFQQSPPKSTGRELFGEDYLRQCWADAQGYDLSPADWLATLTELTAASIAHSYQLFLPQLPDQVLLCGGGSRNQYLKTRIQSLLPTSTILTTDEAGLNVDFKEAITFAVLAYWRQQGFFGNLPQVTGARKSVLLGEIHLVA